MSLFNLSNKYAVIVGGASGIGSAIANIFSSKGAHVFIVDINKEAAQALANSICEQGNFAKAFACNVSRFEEVQTVFNDITKRVGKIDILVNSAGIAHIGNLENTVVEEFDKIYEVNVKGVFNCMQACIPAMKSSGGVILNVASVAASVGITDRFAYSMSKGAVCAMTLSVAKDYIKYGIRCNSISPGRVHTPFVDNFLRTNYAGKEKEMFKKLSASQPIGRMATPEEIAHFALYLCSDEASFVTGCDYPIDGGFIHLNS